MPPSQLRLAACLLGLALALGGLLEAAAGVQVEVRAEERWNAAGLALRAGARYSVRVEPAGQEWSDWYVRCTAEGYTRWWTGGPVAALRRQPGQPFFKLIGCYGQNDSRCFPVGEGAEFVAERDAPLYLYANDARLAYGNNKGALRVVAEEA